MDYDVRYFIDKFNSIPEDQWCELVCTDSQGRHDVWGHCGETDDGHTTDEAFALFRIVRRLGCLSDINNGQTEEVWGNTPKQRVVNFLIAVKNNTI